MLISTVVYGPRSLTRDMHRPIKKFTIDGMLADDADFIRMRVQWEQLLIVDMRDGGYVPVLGLGPLWSTSYDQDKEQYLFELTIYGISVGRKKSLQIEGMDLTGNLIPRHTRQDKSGTSSPRAESK